MSDRGHFYPTQFAKYAECVTHERSIQPHIIRKQTALLSDSISLSQQRGWDKFIPFCLFAYRAAVQECTKETPFYLLYCHDPRLPIDAEVLARVRPYSDAEEYSQDVTRRLNLAWKYAGENIEASQARQAIAYNRLIGNVHFTPGDIVLLFNPQLPRGHTKMLAHLWTGPFTIVDIDNNNAHLQPTGDLKARPQRVHVNRLKPPSYQNRWPATQARGCLNKVATATTAARQWNCKKGVTEPATLRDPW